MKIFLLLFVIVFTIDSFAIGIKSDIRDADGMRRIVTYYEGLFKPRYLEEGSGTTKGSFALSYQETSTGEVKYVFIVLLKGAKWDFVQGNKLKLYGDNKVVTLTLLEDVSCKEVNSNKEMLLRYTLSVEQVKEIRTSKIKVVTFQTADDKELTVKVAHDFNGDFLDCDNEIKERL